MEWSHWLSLIPNRTTTTAWSDERGRTADWSTWFVCFGCIFFWFQPWLLHTKKKTGTSLLARRPLARRQCQSVVDLSGAIDFSENDTSHQPCPCQLTGGIGWRGDDTVSKQVRQVEKSEEWGGRFFNSVIYWFGHFGEKLSDGYLFGLHFWMLFISLESSFWRRLLTEVENFEFEIPLDNVQLLMSRRVVSLIVLEFQHNRDSFEWGWLWV